PPPPAPSDSDRSTALNTSDRALTNTSLCEEGMLKESNTRSLGVPPNHFTLTPQTHTIQTHKPHFFALHCQEVGGKNYEASMSHVDSFVKELLSSDVMKEYNRARVYLDENYKSQEHFTRKQHDGAEMSDTSPPMARLLLYSPVKVYSRTGMRAATEDKSASVADGTPLSSLYP
ncbi:hypothetical protein KUCAC02_037836, partial [Chaenocephalus aceratus]